MISTPIFSVKPDESLWTVQQIMEQRLIRRLMVTGENGELLGIVTQTSILKALNPLELYKLADCLEKQVKQLEAEKVALLESRTADLERQLEARTVALRGKVEREKLVAQISNRIRTSLNLQEILDVCVAEVRSLLNCDRVIVYQFQPDWSAVIIAESVAHGWCVTLGNQIDYACLPPNISTSYNSEQAIVVNNIYTADYTDRYIQLLEQFQVKANLVMPIRVTRQLWGLLIGHQCDHHREWRPEDTTLFRDISIQLEIALQQVLAYQQAQTDLEERKKAEVEREQAFDRLQASEQRYATLTAAAPVGIFRTDAAGRCLYVNDRWCQIAGLTPEAAAGEGWRQGLHPDDQDRIATEWYTSVQENRLFQLEYRFQRPDGAITWVYGQSVAERDVDGQIIGYTGAITDISDRKWAERQLVASENKFRSIFDHAAVGIVHGSFQGELLACNPQFCKMLGYTVAELSQLTVAEITHPDDHPDDLPIPNLPRLIAGEISHFSMEKRYLRKDGAALWSYTTVSLLRDDVGVPLNTVAVIQDISERKHAEAQLHNLITGTAATTGQDFFPALVSHISAALDVSYALVTEKVDGALHTLAFWANGMLQTPLSFQPEKTPCRLTLRDGKFYCEHSVQQQFPDNLELAEMNAESYLGIALRDTQGNTIGDLCILNQRPIPDPQRAENLLRVFAARAAAELERQRANASLEQLNQALEAKVEERTAELQEREQFLQTVLDTFPLSVFWKDRDSVYLGCNRNFLQDVGLSSDTDIIGKTDYDLPKGTEAKGCRADDQQIMNSDSAKLGVIETKIQADGRQLWLETNKLPLHNLKGDVVGVLGTYQDISGRKRVEEALRASETRLQLITDSVHGCIAYMDDSQRYRFVNQTYADWFNCQKADILGRTIEEVIGAQAYRHARQYIERALSGETVNFEAKLPYKGGLNRYISAVFVPDIDSQDRVHGCYALVTDISDRKRAETQIQRYAAQLEVSNRELEAFAYSVSHDLRAPLRAIDGFSKALLEDYGAAFDETGQDYFDRIRKNVFQMGLLIDDLLRLSRVSRSEIRYTTVNLSTLAQELMTELQASEPERKIEFVNAPEAIVSADATLMRVVLTNLLHNACKFTVRHPTARIEFGVVHSEDQPIYFVRDDGAGFDMGYSKKLFGVFQRLHTVHEFPGSGIGLATVQRAIHRHGGRVWAEGAVEQGAAFYFTLPKTPLDLGA